MIDSVQSPSKHIGSYFGSIFNRSQFRWARIFLGYTVLTQCFTTFFNRKPRANAAYCHVFSPIPTSPRWNPTRGGGYATDGGHLCHQGGWVLGFLWILDGNSPASKKITRVTTRWAPKSSYKWSYGAPINGRKYMANCCYNPSYRSYKPSYNW